MCARSGQAVAGQVPIKVAVTPGKRSVYTAGVSYGTIQAPVSSLVSSGVGQHARAKLGAEIDSAQRRESLSFLYRIPAFEWPRLVSFGQRPRGK